MPDVATTGVYLAAALVTILAAVQSYLSARAARAAKDEAASKPSFEGVCEAARDAKVRRRATADGDLPREFVDGVDAVLAQLMEQGYGDDVEEMQAAYLAGGDPEEALEEVSR